MPESRTAGEKIIRHRHFSGSQLDQSGMDIPVSGVSTVRYRWSQISPALPSYGRAGFTPFHLHTVFVNAGMRECRTPAGPASSPAGKGMKKNADA